MHQCLVPRYQVVSCEDLFTAEKVLLIPRYLPWTHQHTLRLYIHKAVPFRSLTLTAYAVRLYEVRVRTARHDSDVYAVPVWYRPQAAISKSIIDDDVPRRRPDHTRAHGRENSNAVNAAPPYIGKLTIGLLAWPLPGAHPHSAHVRCDVIDSAGCP